MAAAAAVAAVVVAACGGGGDGDAPAAAEWELARAMSSRRSYIAGAELEGSVYVAGGMVGETGRPLAVFQRYDPARDAWTTLRPLPEPLRAGAAASRGRTIWVTGGQTERTGGAGGTQVYAYDIDRGAWRAEAPLPEPLFNHAAVVVGGTLYVLGGYAGGRERDAVYAYDEGRRAWEPVARLPRPLHAFGAVAFRGELWTIGGIRDDRPLREVWILSPERGVWRRGPALEEPMELLGADVAGDEIHAVWEHVYQVFDARTGRWRAGPSPRVTRHGLEAFAIDGRFYAIGGCTTALRDSPVVERIAIS